MDNGRQKQLQELEKPGSNGTRKEIENLISKLEPEKLTDHLKSPSVVEQKMLPHICDQNLRSDTLKHFDENDTSVFFANKFAIKIANFRESVTDADSILAGTVVLTTIKNVIRFLSFLRLTTWFYA